MPWTLSVLAVACGEGDPQEGEDETTAADTESPGSTSASDPDTDSGSDTDSDPDTDTDSDTDSDTDTDSDSDSDSGSDTDSDTATDSGAACDADAFELPGEFFYPEGVASHDGELFVGSLATGAIVRIDICDETVDELSPPGDPIRNAIGLRVDPERDVLWVCNSDVEFAAPPTVDALDLATGERIAEHPFADIGFCNDIALDEAGNVYVADSAGHQVHRIAATDALSDTTTESWLFDPAFVVEPGEFGLNGIAHDPADALWVSNYQLGELYRIPIEADGAPGTLEIRALDGELPTPDGVLWHDDGLLVVSGGDSLVSLELSDPVTIDTVQDGLDFGTTVAVEQGAAWVAEGQLDHLFGIDPEPPSLPFVVVRVEL